MAINHLSDMLPHELDKMKGGGTILGEGPVLEEIDHEPVVAAGSPVDWRS